MTDAAQPGPWGPRSTAAAVAAAEQAARSHVPQIARPAVATPATPGGTSKVGFTGEAGQLFGLLAKGLLLQVVTLGLYRFWLITDIRRYYWSHSFVGQEGVAYTGRGIELFKGFLIALAIIVPIQAGSFFLALGLPSAETFISIGGIIIFLFLGQYAVYAARRYRLTRTSFRGLRLRMTGSAWTYAVKAFGLSILVVLSLGLAYPWAATILERIKMRDTWYGDAQGDFVGTAGTLMRRGILIWALGFGLPVLIIVMAIASVPFSTWETLGDALTNDQFDPRGAVAVALFTIAGAISTSIFIPFLLWPAFQAVVFRWRMEGIRIGGAALSSDFTIGTSYRVYILGGLALGAIILALSVVVMIALGGAIAAMFYGGMANANASAAGILGVGFIVLGYVVVFGVFWIAKQLLIDLRLHRYRLRSLSVINLAALDSVRAHNVDASAMGDSLGDAVDIGFGIG